MLEFRNDMEGIIRKVQKGKRMILTNRGRPVIRLEPILDFKSGPDDPFYSLGRWAVSGAGSLNNAEIDDILYHA